MKKKLIMDKALELFAKQGFEATSIQQITEHCGISKGAFYLSFKSKDELILALIDHFMTEFTTNIDYVVRNTKHEKLLYEFYYATFHSFLQHSDFAKILIKEQSHTLNEELIVKMHDYNRVTENIILSMIDRFYGDEIKQINYDLMYCIKGFMNTYSQLFLFYNVPLDLNLLSESLVEKTNLLAWHTKVPFISEELIQVIKTPISEEGSKDQILEMMEQKLEEIEEPIEKESLMLLKQHLLEPTLSPAIVKGLLENIRNHPQCKWVSYLLQDYFKF
ncbi:MAG TPA: TetR/AcrR family transcriptional regulator [Pseudoneobacillus sp.]|nr:TetR/AcrR family transcriptional regulator [Pseudoneobacillus sp.]